MPSRLEDYEEERFSRVEEIMRRNRIDYEDLEAYVARVRERAARVREQAMKSWPALPPPRKKRR